MLPARSFSTLLDSLEGLVKPGRMQYVEADKVANQLRQTHNGAGREAGSLLLVLP
jgi:hypothetical protein